MKKLSAPSALPRLGLLLLLWLAALAARSQNACPTPPPAACPEPFRVVDAGTGQEVRTLTVGCPVRFVQAACRPATLPTLLYYQVVQGTNAIPPNCLPTTTAGATTYTPTAADVGPVTVFELSNPDPSSGAGGAGVAYIRNYQVVAPTPPAFTVAPCAGNTALLTLTNSGYSQYTVQVNGGAPQLLTSQPVNIAPGVANTFVVTGSIAGSSCLQSTTQTLTLPVAQAPMLARLTRLGTAASGGPAQFDLAQVPAGFTYTLQAQTTGQPYQTVPGTPASGGTNTATLTLGQVPPGRYRIARTDACGNTAFSNEVPTLGLSGTADNGRNVLTFDLYGGAAVASYSLARSDGAVITLGGSVSTYVDASVQCGRAYDYRLTATLVGSGIIGTRQTVSNTLSLTAQSTTPPPAPLVVASFDLRNRVVVTASPGAGAATFGAGGQVIISRQASGAAPVAYAPLRTGSAAVPRLVLRDSTALGTLLAAPPCYAATLRDTCGNVSSVSPSSCPALLTVEAADPEGQSAQLRWSAFQGPGGPAAGATYQVLTLGADGAVLAISAPLTGLTYLDPAPPLDRQIVRYRVLASGAGLPTGTVSYSNVGTLTRRPRLVLPTAFTPNGDGLNDVLELKGRYLQSFTFIVVDRNGQEVFRTTDRAQTWDGSINGRPPVNAAYVWRLDLRGEDGQPLRQTGTITILK
ncbi:gliding motility-associated C-terminal domain-containing protein [Hymenobacter bucti]|uniref:Gliding motility-associated C-terminal domain-containing protein n=1 Tax=Hymenobacter bucti TaxID=1844114 RepID=A0ABW4QRE0_9BACT